MSKRYRWKLKNRELLLGERTLLMGVLNVTPDSFSDGGKYLDPDRAYARALELEEEGADIIDIGAESTKPGASRLPETEELRRLVPVLKRLRDKLSVPVSVDTYKSAVAERSLDLGAEIINDPSGNLWDLQLAKVVTRYDAGFIINHMRGTPETWAKLAPLQNPMRSIAIDLEAAINRARLAGVQKHQIAIDPGLGFGKRREQNAEIISQLHVLGGFDGPIAIGPSRKSFLKAQGEEELEFATAAAVAASILHGAHILRVHDVKRMKIVAEVTDSIRYAQSPEEASEARPVRQDSRQPQERSRDGGGNEPQRRRAIAPKLRQTPTGPRHGR